MVDMADTVVTVEAMVDMAGMEAMVDTVARGRLKPPLLLPLKLTLKPTEDMAAMVDTEDMEDTVEFL